MIIENNARRHDKEHILLCLSATPANEKIMQIALRMSDAYNGTLTALFVETPASKKTSVETRTLLSEYSELAEQPGAQITIVRGNNIARQISEYAKSNNITKIVIGHSVNRKTFGVCWKNNVDKITSLLMPDIEVYVVN